MDKKTKVDQLKEMMKAKKEAEEKNTRDEGRGTKDDSPPVPPLEKGGEGGFNINTDEMSAQIKAAEDEAKVHHDKLLRVMAEFENFKKRIERERIEHLKYTAQSLINDLLPVLDDFDRVLGHIPQEATTGTAAIVDGVKIIQNHFIAALSKHGLVPLESAVGKPFDPCEHEAISHIESSEHPEGTVIEEHRRGWKLYDRVVRAAAVVVAKGMKKEI